MGKGLGRGALLLGAVPQVQGLAGAAARAGRERRGPRVPVRLPAGDPAPGRAERHGVGANEAHPPLFAGPDEARRLETRPRCLSETFALSGNRAACGRIPFSDEETS
jgi:hypothetical protein